MARLLVAPPPVVCKELKFYSTDVQTSPYTAASEELGASLAARNDSLIDLAIASLGASHETIGELYRKGKSPAVDGTDAQYRQGLRLSVLANETIDSKGFLSRFPENTIALGRRNWMFVGSIKGGHASALFYSLVETCKLNGVEPEACARRQLRWPVERIDELLPWRWQAARDSALAA